MQGLEKIKIWIRIPGQWIYNHSLTTASFFRNACRHAGHLDCLFQVCTIWNVSIKFCAGGSGGAGVGGGMVVQWSIHDKKATGSRPGAFPGGVFMFSLCLRGFSRGSPASSHNPKTHTWGDCKLLLDHRRECEWLFISMWPWQLVEGVRQPLHHDPPGRKRSSCRKPQEANSLLKSGTVAVLPLPVELSKI